METRSGPRAPEDVDATLLAHVGDVERPRAAISDDGIDLSHLPGDRSPLGALRVLYRVLRHGNGAAHHFWNLYGPVAAGKLGSIESANVWDFDAVEEMLRNKEGTWSVALAWRSIFGAIDGRDEEYEMLLTTDFHTHSIARRLVQPAFGRRASEGYRAIAQRHFDAAIDGWLESGRTSFKRDARRLFANVAQDIFLGLDDADEAAAWDRELSEFWSALFFAWKKSARWSPKWRRGIAAYRSMEAKLLQLYEERAGDESRTDMFSWLVRTAESEVASEASAEVAFLTERRALARFFIGIMIAAFDTTSAAVTSMGYSLARYPEWQERLREEVGTAAPDAHPENPRAFPQLDWVWKETLRRWPVAGGVQRRALRETTILEHRIPAGAAVWANFGAAFYDETFWTDPLHFDPERFSPERAEHKRRPGLYVPFGFGPHACIGSQLSALEAKSFFAALLRRTRFRLRRDYDARHTSTPMGMVSGKVDLIVETLDA